MKRSSAFLSIALGALTQAEVPSNEHLATYGLTLSQFEMIKASESPYDFGGIDDTDQQQLWLDAAVFSYQLATQHATDHVASSLSYLPYVVCNNSTGLSGVQRIKQIHDIFNNTSGVSDSDFYELDRAVVNVANTTCGLMRLYNDTVAVVFGENPGVEEWLSVQPLHQSMKMNNMTVEIFQDRFDSFESGDYDLSPDKPSDWFIYVNLLGAESILCPGVQDFGGEDVPDEEIVDSIRDFIIKDGGSHVREASFFYERVKGNSTGDVYTDRMTMWAGYISDIDTLTKGNGTNYCRDTIIGENFAFDLDTMSLGVHAEINSKELSEIGASAGLVQDDLENCMMYLVMGLALNPMICWVEPKSYVQALCPDGTADLTKCPEPEPAPETPDSSSHKNGRHVGGIISVFSMALSLGSYFLSS
ncbi:hypothetical protein HJC23_014052 [Cyclotella cryptica]|uniref:Phospholipase B-like n=1 Tax=Cyclotella cryptica TaxID=29204 RepID=A0ABD3QUF0_9STRA|eukprot:CCRYP_002442-RA/>CCRYP_002442-RA protein AED:0.41 eAED:0.41 QI:0/-1/0/1/-1/1/1/0/416